MSLRLRILVGSLLVAVIPLVLATQVIRRSVEQRITDMDADRATNLVKLVNDDLDRLDAELARRLDALAISLAADNRFRLGLLADGGGELAYVRDFAGRRMSVMGLDVLQILDDDGTVRSSGHFREAHDADAGRLPDLLAGAPGGRALITARHPEGSFLALARTRPVTLGDRRLHLVAGSRLDVQRLRSLNRDAELALAVVWPGGSLATTESLAARIDVPGGIDEIEYRLRRSGAVHRSEYIPAIVDGRLDEAWLLVTQERAALTALLRELNLRLAMVLAVAVVVALVLGSLLAGSLSRPLRELAARTEDLDLDRLDVEFRSERNDEVGRLTRLLGAMTERLREGVHRLRQAEHRATLGEVARQVNHDIRNGLTPLRNVLGHLTEVARDEPGELPRIFRDRQQTLTDGLAYLEQLAGHYRRLGADRRAEPCALADVVAAALADGGSGPGVALVNSVPTGLPPVLADPVSLRRIVDNLVRNAVESLPAEGGTVTVDGFVGEDEHLGEPRIQLSVGDDGCGIAPEHLDEVFNDFFTTKSGGTGLGLSNVRRLMADAGGSVRVRSEPGRGTVFTLSFPVPGVGDGPS